MRDVTIDDMAVFDTAVWFIRREQPGVFLEIIDRTLARRIMSLNGAALQCLNASCLMLMLAAIGVWWLALPCLPLSLTGAHFIRAERRLRRRWSAPAIEELGARWANPSSPAPQPTGAAR